MAVDIDANAGPWILVVLFRGKSFDVDAELFTILEGVRWAPSSFNHQPWRFVYAHRGSPDWERFVDLLLPFNAMWARPASVLLIIASNTMIQLPRDTAQTVSHSHSFDAGAAWAFMALQATRLGIRTRHDRRRLQSCS
jgi:nitroreductase